MTNTTRRTKIAGMTLLAMLVAVLIVLAFVNIPMPMGLSITFNMIPVAIAVMAMGMSGGLIIGGAFGLISFLQCFGIFGTSALGAALVNVQKGYNFFFSVLFGICGGLGFTLSIVLFASVRERLEFAEYPKAFEGFPIALVTAGLLAMAFMGFSGLNLG